LKNELGFGVLNDSVSKFLPKMTDDHLSVSLVINDVRCFFKSSALCCGCWKSVGDESSVLLGLGALSADVVEGGILLCFSDCCRLGQWSF